MNTRIADHKGVLVIAIPSMRQHQQRQHRLTPTPAQARILSRGLRFRG
jgi:hypothetical protein